jgi:Fic family protein
VAGVVSEAETEIQRLNDVVSPALGPLGRLLLRTEAIASSKIEGLQIGVRQLAGAEVKFDAGRKAAPTALEVLANIDAMELAMSEASSVECFRLAEILAIHRRLMRRQLHADRIAGRIRAS